MKKQFIEDFNLSVKVEKTEDGYTHTLLIDGEDSVYFDCDYECDLDESLDHINNLFHDSGHTDFDFWELDFRGNKEKLKEFFQLLGTYHAVKTYSNESQPKDVTWLFFGAFGGLLTAILGLLIYLVYLVRNLA